MKKKLIIYGLIIVIIVVLALVNNKTSTTAVSVVAEDDSLLYISKTDNFFVNMARIFEKGLYYIVSFFFDIIAKIFRSVFGL